MSIVLNQADYVKDIPPINVLKSRRVTRDASVTEEERHALHALVGSLQYAAVNTRPDLCRAVGALQSAINKACFLICFRPTLLHEAKRHADVALKVCAIPTEQIRFVCFSDALFASEKEQRLTGVC